MISSSKRSPGSNLESSSPKRTCIDERNNNNSDKDKTMKRHTSKHHAIFPNSPKYFDMSDDDCEQHRITNKVERAAERQRSEQTTIDKEDLEKKKK